MEESLQFTFGSKEAFKNYLLLFCSSVYDASLQECHSVLHAGDNPSLSVVPEKDSDDVYPRFGGAALAAMLHSRYDKGRKQKNE